MFKSQIDENGPKWVQNGRQAMRIDPWACRGHFLASGTGPAAQNHQFVGKPMLVVSKETRTFGKVGFFDCSQGRSLQE